MVNVEVVGSVSSIAQYGVISSGPLISSSDCFQIPIRPEDEIIKDRNGENVRHFEHILDDVSAILAVKVGIGDVIEMSISPKEFISHVIDG